MNVIGLDVSKDTIDATLITTKGSKDYIKISNSTEGFENLINWIKNKKNQKNCHKYGSNGYLLRTGG